MAAFPLSSCFRRTACFPLLSGIVLPAQTQSSRGHIFHFTLYMRLRYISTPFLPLFPFFGAPQEMPVLPEKSSFFLLSASFCLYLTGQAVLPAFGIFKISRSIFGIYTISFFVVFRTASRKRRFLFREPICTPCKRRKGLCSRPACRRYNSRRLHCPTHHRSVRHFSRTRLPEACQSIAGPLNLWYIVVFSILGRLHFQLLTNCQQLLCTFFFQSLLQFRPIVTCAALVWLVG